MIKKHTIIFSLIAGLVLTYYLLGITCPFLLIFKIPCPTCGMTRSLISLLHLDFKSYSYWNIFTVPVIISCIILIHSNRIKAPYKHSFISISLLILFANFTYYIYRLILYLNSQILMCLCCYKIQSYTYLIHLQLVLMM